ncbi:hypothetical protein [Reinekea sp. G2M2-21]|uniref:hypothetical protein n=1 Tax=Reinekea sp. G2M2-21 TaxID=2788942 RepID=UPI0018AB337E|nr:hypothetical protein [Reinekea sp. G2M2-21]
MKAIFAVTALAAAISAQAMAADTEATTSFTGAMDAQFILNLEPATDDPATTDEVEGTLVPVDSTYDVDLKEDDYNYGISIETAVVNGPFSGSIGLKSDENNEAEITVGDLVVTDGKLSFGQVGNLMSTDEYTGEMEEAGTLDVDVAFKYAVMDGFTVQLQGQNDDALTTRTGVAAQYTGEAGALSYTAEAEMYASAVGAELDLDAPYFAGVGVTYTADVATVKAATNLTGDTAGNTVTEYAVSVDSTVAGATLSASWTDVNADNDDDEIAKVEVSYAAGAVTPSAGYTFTTLADAGDELWAKVAYAADSYNASAKVIMENFDGGDAAADPKIELRADTTSEVGVTYYAEFDFQTDTTNMLTVGAKYSF